MKVFIVAVLAVIGSIAVVSAMSYEEDNRHHR